MKLFFEEVTTGTVNVRLCYDKDDSLINDSNFALYAEHDIYPRHALYFHRNSLHRLLEITLWLTIRIDIAIDNKNNIRIGN